MVKYLRVNMADKTAAFQAPAKEYELLGGRALIAKLLTDEVDPTCDPLSADNKLIVCNGILAGTTAPTSGRLSVGAKSPLTGTIKEANSGGTFANRLARIGLRAVIVEGMPADDQWHLLKIKGDQAEILPANQYVGLNNYDLAAQLQKEYGAKIAIASIGCAGERGYKNATVQVVDMEGRPTRAAARGGLGAVMGSKKLKAIIIESADYREEVVYADKEKFQASVKGYVQGIKDNPISGQAMPALGTAVLVNPCNGMGALPTNNFSVGNFADAEKLSGEQLAAMQKERGGKNGHICQPGCPIGCSNIYNDEKGEFLTGGFEYETIVLNGSNIGISSLDTIARIDRLCDDLGIDTMETGCTIGVCMDAGKIAFGDESGALALIQEMIDGTEFGLVMGQGTNYTGKQLGATRIPTVKNQSLAAYDPRALKGTGVTYATSPMGADHTAGNSFGDPSVVPDNKEGQVALSTQLQVGMATFDSLGMCIFSGFCVADPVNVGHMLGMLAGRYGGEWGPDQLFGIGVGTIAMEKKFNKSAGFTEKDDRLPEFMYQEALSPQNAIFDIDDEELAQAIPF